MKRFQSDHFSTIGPKLASEIPLNNGSSYQEYITDLDERFQFYPTDNNQVLSLFKNLINRKELVSMEYLVGLFLNALI